MVNLGLGVFDHILTDGTTQDEVCDPWVIAHPDRNVGREALFGNLYLEGGGGILLVAGQG